MPQRPIRVQTLIETTMKCKRNANMQKTMSQTNQGADPNRTNDAARSQKPIRAPTRIETTMKFRQQCLGNRLGKAQLTVNPTTILGSQALKHDH